MKRNLGSPDRLIRGLIAVVAVAIGVAHGGPWAIVFYVVAAIMLLTSTSAFCPVYAALHLHTDHRS